MKFARKAIGGLMLLPLMMLLPLIMLEIVSEQRW